MFGAKKETKDKAAMRRIVAIIEDMRPLFEDRIRALSPDGFVLGELIKEIKEIAISVGDLKEDTGTVEETTNDKFGVDDNANGEPEGDLTEVGPVNGAARKGNAAARHAAAIASGKTTIE